MFAELIACLLFVPVDVIKERRQVQSTLKAFTYKSDLDAIKQIKSTEGARGLYRAYFATVLSFGPFSALYFMFYEKAKGFVVNNDPTNYLKKVKAECEEGKAAART
jgi:Mitochondrial carrier protein